MSSLILAVACVATFSIVYVIIIPLYHYFRDAKGLRRYPAINAIAGISNIGFMIEAYRGNRSMKLYELHKQHPIVRIGPNSLSYGNVNAIKDIYGHGTPCLKDDFYVALSGTHFHLADVVDKQQHSSKRRVLAAAYALKNLEGWEHKIADKTKGFLRACDRHVSMYCPNGKRPGPGSPTFDYRAYTNFFTLDAIADIGLSEKLGFLDAGSDAVLGEKADGTVYKVPSYTASLHATARVQSVLVWATNWYHFNTSYLCKLIPDLNKLWRLNEGWNDLVYRRAAERLRRYENDEKLDDFFQCLMVDRAGKPNNLPFGEVIAEISIMLNAGSDTTALAMNNVMYNLLKNEQCLARLRAEVDSALDPGEEIAPYEKVKRLPYLRACLDESLRLTPPTTFGLPRRTPTEGARIANAWAPGDTTVSVSAWVAHRDPSVFPEPERYNPDRWLGEKGKELQSYFISFSTGARGCIGRNISYLEQTVLLASVVHRYEFALLSPEWEQERIETFNLMAGPLPLHVWRRDRSSDEG